MTILTFGSRSTVRLYLAALFLLSGAPQPPAMANVPTDRSEHLAPDVKLLLDRAQEATRRGDLRVATLLLKNAAQSAPHSAAVQAQLGNVLVMQSQMVQAERILRQARSAGAPDSTVLPALFQAMLSQHEGQALLDQFPEPSGNSQTSVDTLRARALAYFSLKQTEKADAQINKALAIRRGPSLLVNKAEFEIAKGDRASGNVLIDEALKTSPTDRTALIMKIGLLERQDDFPAALSYANKLVQSSPGDPLPLVLRIEVLAKLKRDKEAEGDVDTLLKSAPNMPVARYDRALLLARKGDIRGAWQTVQGLSPEFIHSAPQFGLGYAKIAQASGNSELSDAVLTALISSYPGNEEARRMLAERRISQKNYSAALDLLQPMADSAEPRTLLVLGKTYQALGQGRQAQDYLSRAQAGRPAGTVNDNATPIDKLRETVAKDPRNADATGVLILALIGQGKIDDARAVAEGFDTASPKSPMSTYFHGQIAMNNGDFDSATAAFTSTLHAMPGFVPALYYRAQVAAARGDWLAADTDLDAILRSDPRNAQALSKKAAYAIAAGRDDDAAALLQKAVAASPNAAEPQLAVADFLLKRGKFAQAQTAAARVLDRFPDDLRAVSLLVRADLALHATDRAKALAQKISVAKPQSAEAQLLLAYVLEKSGDGKGAMASYLAAARAEPKAGAAYVALASYYLRTGQKDKAVESARTLSEQSPSAGSDLLLADTLLKAGYPGASRSVLEKSVATRPNSQTVLALVAIQMRTDRQGAQSRLASWVAAHDRDVAAQNQLANMMIADGNAAGARSHLELALRFQPYNASILNDLAWAVQKSDPTRALKLATRAANISPQSGEILDTLAWLKWQQNNRSEGLGLLQKAHSLSPAEPNIAYHLAVALDSSGDRIAARNLLQIALKPGAGLSNRQEAQQLQAKWN